jgi:uncharacterized repeat protein (TIGR03803 family)
VVAAFPGPLNRSPFLAMPNKIKDLKSYIRQLVARFGVCAVVIGLASSASAQWNEQVLYSFQYGADGAGPVGRIVSDKQGNLYGATVAGGSSSCAGPAQCGTVYELSPPTKNGAPWTETVLHVFQGRAFGDGSTPGGGLVMDATGNLYGTAAYDGTGPCRLLGGLVGCGVIYEMSPPAQPRGSWTETVIYNFQGGNDGYLPGGDLVFDKAGNLYGATVFGGGRGVNCGNSLDQNCGTIFELSPPQTKGGTWTEKVLYSFAGIETWSSASDGSEPNGGLVFDEAGDIYGTTEYGGSAAGIVCQSRQGCGTVFELIPPQQKGGAWTEDVLHRFLAQPSDGVGPYGNLVLSGGSLYGTTRGGGSRQDGVIYQLEPLGNGDDAWVEDLIHVFMGGSDGQNPSALIPGPDGMLYGTSGSGPTHGGLIFRMQPPAQKGGAWDLIPEYDFTGSPNGYGPFVLNLVPGRHEMYGSTLEGGTGPCDGGCGTVFGVKP